MIRKYKIMNTDCKKMYGNDKEIQDNEYVM